jgi:hypothetical protein
VPISWTIQARNWASAPPESLRRPMTTPNTIATARLVAMRTPRLAE